MSRIETTLVALMLLVVPRTPAESDPELSAATIYQRAVASTLALKVTTTSGEEFVGAAFLITSTGLAVTAWHLVHDAREIRARFVDGTPAKTELCGAGDELHDLALLRISPSSAPPLPLRVETPPIGSRIYAIGSPRGYAFSIVDGLLSQVPIVDDFPQYQLSCPFSPGNSGGPVLDNAGNVIGISSWSKVGAQNLNFAIPARFAAELCRREEPASPLTLRAPTAAPLPGCAPRPDENARHSPLSTRSETFADFQQHLLQLAGQPARIVVSAAQSTRTFEFILPTETDAPTAAVASLSTTTLP